LGKKITADWDTVKITNGIEPRNAEIAPINFNNTKTSYSLICVNSLNN
jgi:hypothetical protein